MGLRLTDLEEGTKVNLLITSTSGKMKLDAYIKKVLKDDLAVIVLDYPSGKILNFSSVKTDMEYFPEGDMPVIWRNVKIVYYKSEYVLQILAEGGNHNRRECFRVGVHAQAKLLLEGHGMKSVLVRDVSLSGFSIADRKQELHLKMGTKISISIEDGEYNLDLVGIVVRIEEREDVTIYGFEICNICKPLSAYITEKQRVKRVR